MLAKHSINKLCCHEIYKSTNDENGKQKECEACKVRPHQTAPPRPVPGSLLLPLLLWSVALWGSLVWLVTRQTNELRRQRQRQQRPRPDAIQAGRTDGCGFAGCAVCDRCPLPQLPLVIFKTATVDDGQGAASVGEREAGRGRRETMSYAQHCANVASGSR